MGKIEKIDSYVFLIAFFLSKAAVDKAFVARSKKRNTLRKCLDSEV